MLSFGKGDDILSRGKFSGRGCLHSDFEKVHSGKNVGNYKNMAE